MCCLFGSQLVFAAHEAKIVKIKGEVKVRRGLEETWQVASRGMDLNIIDSILILEGEVELEIQDGLSFRLSSNSMLDIADLRKITRKQMFLFLMTEKVDKIPPRAEKTKLKIGNVSVVHGESKAKTSTSKMNDVEQKWQQELNGAKALFRQDYYPNSIVKLHKIHKKYSSTNDFGEIHFYLGKAFEEMDESGQAVDAYQIAMEKSKDCELAKIKQLRSEAEKAVKQLIQ
jgi:hypothetical protein